MQPEQDDDLLYCYLCATYKPRSEMGDVACLDCEEGDRLCAFWDREYEKGRLRRAEQMEMEE